MNIRKQILNSVLKGTNNINRLMEDKLDDFILVNQPPEPIKLGRKTLYIGTFNLGNEHRFFHTWAKIIGLIETQIGLMQVHDDRKKELNSRAGFDLLANGTAMMEFVLMFKWIHNHLFNLFYKLLLKNK